MGSFLSRHSFSLMGNDDESAQYGASFDTLVEMTIITWAGVKDVVV